MNCDLYVTILAGGMGKRMNSMLPKVLHEIYDVDGNCVPMLVNICKQVILLKPKKIIVVVSPVSHDLIKNTLEKFFPDTVYNYCVQSQSLGTGHALIQTINELDNDHAFNLILNGDVPFITIQTLSDITSNMNIQLAITVSVMDDPTGNGRVVTQHTPMESDGLRPLQPYGWGVTQRTPMESDGLRPLPCVTQHTPLESDGPQSILRWSLTDKNIFSQIIEDRDCDPEQKKIQLVNCGIYFCKICCLKNIMPLINNYNVQSEYYITDIFNIGKQLGYVVDMYHIPPDKIHEIYNINTQSQLEFVNSKK